MNIFDGLLENNLSTQCTKDSNSLCSSCNLKIVLELYLIINGEKSNNSNM